MKRRFVRSVLASVAALAVLATAGRAKAQEVQVTGPLKGAPAVRHLLIQMRPDGLDDVIRALALVRPGAAAPGMKELYVRLKRGLEPVQAHPLLEPLLRETLTNLLHAEADSSRRQAAEAALHSIAGATLVKPVHIPNYTDLTPVIQISEVVVERA